ncbi:MAG TPA: alkaline phosphatase [Phycisphaerae bacterium]|nr:alkaline phosphatase [Phycisphaerae bacterium]
MENRIGRRELLEWSAALGAAVVSGPVPRAFAVDGPATLGRRLADDPPRNIIFMVSDGMSLGVPSMAEPFSRAVRGAGTHWLELLASPECRHGWMETGSLNSLVTDSAAASSAWGSGSRVFNDAVNMLPDGTRLTPVAELARSAGRRVGLVTTTTITHATPAGFAAVQACRDDEAEIAPQYLERVDVLMGGGREYYLPELRKDQRDLVAAFKRAGYALWTRRDHLRSEDRPPRVLGLFGQGHLPFTIDQRSDERLAREVPTLAEMTQAALDILGRVGARDSDDRHDAGPPDDPPAPGFLLMVEGGRVDHAAHANDAAALLWDQLAFDDAIRVATAFAARRRDTLVVVTTDHGNANPGLNGMGSNYRESDRCFGRLTGFTGSYETLKRRATRGLESDKAPAADHVTDVVRALTQIVLSRAEAATLAEALVGRLPPELSRQHANLIGVTGQIFGNHTGVGWTGKSHTADLALTTALGPGAEAFAGVLRNTDVFAALTAAMGIRHRNPSMTPAEAQRFAAAATSRHVDAWS